MCYQLVELYSSCRCLYYRHAVDRCQRYGRPGHWVTKRTILVGYACQDHSSRSHLSSYDSRPFRNQDRRASASSTFTESSSDEDQLDAIPFRGDESRTTAQQPTFARNTEQTELPQSVERLEGPPSASEPTPQSDLTKPAKEGGSSSGRRVQGAAISETSASNSQLQNDSQQPDLKNDIEQRAIQSTATVEYADKDGNVIPDQSSRTARSKIGTRRRSPVERQSNTSHKKPSLSPAPTPPSISSPDEPNLTEQLSTSQSAQEAGSLKGLVSTKKSRVQEDKQRSNSKGNKSKEVAFSQTKGSDTDIARSGINITDADEPVSKSSINETRGIAHFQSLKENDASTTTTQAENSIESSDGTTLSEQGRNFVEILVTNLASDCILQQFWPRLILQSESIDTAHQHITRLLLSYSFSLQDLARTLTDNGDSRDSNQRSMTANAIESHSSAISCALCLIFWSPDLEPDAHQVGFRHLADLAEEFGSLNSWEVTESKVLEDFLFRTDPLLILREDARVLVEQPLPLPLHIRMIDAARYWYESVNSLIVASDPRPGGRRLFYTCQCGRKLYDDYNEIRPGALDELRLLLRRNKFKVNDSGDLESNKTLGPLPKSSGTTQSSNLLNKIRDIRLPIYWQKQDWSKLGKCARKTSQTQNEERHNYILTCVPFGRLVYKLQQPEVCTIRSDQDFFSLLRVTYQQHRTRTPLSFLRRVKAINFVQFDFYRTQFADVRSHPALPPDTLGDQYMYDPMPTDILPPIGSNLLVHFLENPTHAGGLQDLFKRIPRKLRDRLSPCPQKGMSVGWGLALTEGIDPFVFFLCGCVGFLICLLAALAWTIGKDDVQGGFGIGAFLLSFTLFCGGLVYSSVTARELSTG